MVWHGARSPWRAARGPWRAEDEGSRRARQASFRLARVWRRFARPWRRLAGVWARLAKAGAWLARVWGRLARAWMGLARVVGGPSVVSRSFPGLKSGSQRLSSLVGPLRARIRSRAGGEARASGPRRAHQGARGVLGGSRRRRGPSPSPRRTARRSVFRTRSRPGASGAARSSCPRGAARCRHAARRRW